MSGRSIGFVGLLGSTVLIGAFGAACTDPVYDERIDALGGEAPNVPPGPKHRPGQPCVVCHSESGPADDSPFTIAGTVFRTPGKLNGMPGVEVLLVDANGSSPADRSGTRTPILTNESGNFYVPKALWNPAFPIRVNIYCGVQPTPACPLPGTRRVMQGHIGREPDCNVCHFDPVNPQGRRDAYEALYAVGHIYLTTNE